MNMNGEQLKLEIKKRGFTFKQVAEALGDSTTNFSNKLGKEQLSTSFMEEVAGAIGCSPAEFYGFSPNDDAAESVRRENALLRDLAGRAMQGYLSCDMDFSDDVLKGDSVEHYIAHRSMKYAYALLDEFKKRGIDK